MSDTPAPKTPRLNYKKNHDHSKKTSTTASKVRPRNQIVPEVKEGLLAPRKGGPKAIHRKDITLPPTVAEAAQVHADSLGMSDQTYYNSAIIAYFSRVITGEVQLIEPQERCPACGLKGNKFTKPNVPAPSGFHRVRVGVRFTDAVAKMLFQLAEDWFVGTWSHAFEFAVRDYLGKHNPPPEGKGKVAGVSMKNLGRSRNGETAEERLVRALARETPS